MQENLLVELFIYLLALIPRENREQPFLQWKKERVDLGGAQYGLSPTNPLIAGWLPPGPPSLLPRPEDTEWMAGGVGRIDKRSHLRNRRWPLCQAGGQRPLLKAKGGWRVVSRGGLAQAHPTCAFPPCPLTCRIPCTLTGSPALPGQRPGRVDSNNTLRRKEGLE